MLCLQNNEEEYASYGIYVRLDLERLQPRLCGLGAVPPGPDLRSRNTGDLYHPFLLSGKGTYTVKGTTYELHAGQLFCFSPYEVICYKADEADPWNYIWINFVITGSVPYRFEQPVVDAPFLRPIFEELKNYPHHETTGRDFTTNCLYQIATQLSAQQSNTASLVESAIDYIHHNYNNEDLSIASIAAKLKISRYTLSEIFSLEKGTSPVEYLVRYRLEKACEYMVRQKLPPTIAANSVGYTNYVHFGKIFKKYYGVSPRSYVEKALREEHETKS